MRPLTSSRLVARLLVYSLLVLLMKTVIPSKGQTATKEAVEREPLVRVNLVDGEGNIVLYGYIKVRIVEKPVVDMKVEVNLGDLYFNCGDEGKMTWSQVENLILSKLGTDGMTKQAFENEYYL